MANNSHDFLGRGWSFPPTFDRARGTVLMVSAEQDIRQSLQILFSTIRTERVLLPDYGCDLSSVVFDSIDEALELRVKHLVGDAILFFEPRILVTAADIAVTADPGQPGLLRIHLSFLIRQTNTRSNMVYPFYCGEGSNVRRIGAG